MTEVEGQETRLDGRAWALIAAAWLVVALAWTPAAYLTAPGAPRGAGVLVAAFVQILIHFAPWALSTPVFLRLSRRFPVGLGNGTRSLLVFAVLGVALVPVFTTLGVTASRTVVGLAAGRSAADALSGIGRPVLITSLFAIPTYVAIVAIGQTAAYLERYRQRERLLSLARAESLRAQIAPHFLFNALNAISALVHSNPARADAAMVRLAGLLRETLERPQWTTLREEVSLVADYVELHRLLLGERLAFSLDIGAAAWDARLPSMLLQPLVENALAHGVARLADGGALSLSASPGDTGLRIEIVNDMPSPAVSNPGAGIGLANVRRRLAAAYGDAARLDFAAAHGTARALIELPFEPARQ